MARQGMPMPLVRAGTVGSVRPLGDSLAGLWRKYLGFLRAQGVSASHLRNNERTAALSAPLGEFPEAGAITQWLQNMAAKPSTVRLHLWNLHACYAWSLANNHTAINPAYKLRWKRPAPQRHAVWEIETLWPKFLGTVADERERALVAVLRFAGLRIGEALALRPVDVWRHVAPWEIHVAGQRNAHALERSETLKTVQSRRAVEVRPELRALLAPVFAREPFTAAARVGRGGGSWVETELLFASRANDLARLMAGFREVDAGAFPADDAWHVWRHTFAVELWRWGRSELQISQALGHVSLEYTAGYLRSLAGGRATKGLFAGMDAPAPWSASPAVQRGLPLGPLNAVQTTKGGAPPARGREKRRAPEAATSEALQAVQRSSNPRNLVLRTTHQQHHPRKAVSL